MGREWNDKLRRKLQDSFSRALDVPRPTRMLVTDLEPFLGQEPTVLVELLGVPDDLTEEIVIAQFIVKRRGKPRTPRYREETNRWPGKS